MGLTCFGSVAGLTIATPALHYKQKQDQQWLYMPWIMNRSEAVVLTGRGWMNATLLPDTKGSA